ncbi:copper chaperone [Natranaerovirga hydrolytica]|uniref:Copper chaperone n=1 Tax=Natranaerovirga hydrolytica TaxID=680378 RepID=A0A4R1MYP7_9FIRM|nr:heavy-metal-associated domain-containing protein [Natranaerovirga hydrolytica]TCK97730.1 copper chaperone [Natranaerovirga hydrolytica]
MTKKVMIEGMSCEHCVKHTKTALENIKGVIDVDVSLEGSYATVEGDYIEDDVIKEAIEEAGYDVSHISHV